MKRGIQVIPKFTRSFVRPVKRPANPKALSDKFSSLVKAYQSTRDFISKDFDPFPQNKKNDAFRRKNKDFLEGEKEEEPEPRGDFNPLALDYYATIPDKTTFPSFIAENIFRHHLNSLEDESSRHIRTSYNPSVHVYNENKDFRRELDLFKTDASNSLADSIRSRHEAEENGADDDAIEGWDDAIENGTKKLTEIEDYIKYRDHYFSPELERWEKQVCNQLKDRAQQAFNDREEQRRNNPPPQPVPQVNVPAPNMQDFQQAALQDAIQNAQEGEQEDRRDRRRRRRRRSSSVSLPKRIMPLALTVVGPPLLYALLGQYASIPLPEYNQTSHSNEGPPELPEYPL